MEDSLHKGALPHLFNFARENRKSMTVSEQLLWKSLRGRKLKGFKFRRQHPLGDFIVDFFCLECNLAIELDGEYHSELGQANYDEGRTYELEELEIRVIRFSNKEVIDNIDFVLKEISKYLIRAS